jgi:histidyl-tRNA synthetase
VWSLTPSPFRGVGGVCAPPPRLREAGWRTSLPLSQRKLTKEIGRADRSGARAVVIIGPDEWDRGEVAVRTLASGEQQAVAADVVAAKLAELLS